MGSKDGTEVGMSVGEVVGPATCRGNGSQHVFRHECKDKEEGTSVQACLYTCSQTLQQTRAEKISEDFHEDMCMDACKGSVRMCA